VRIFDIVSCAVVALFGLTLLFVIIPGWTPVESGPGFGLAATTMPNVAVVTATMLAATFFLYRVLDLHPDGESYEEYDATSPIERKNWLFLLRGSLFLIAMTALFEWAGFLVAGPPTVVGFMLMMGEKRPLAIVIASVGATAAIWLFFWQFLKFPLP
jgi:hypothetical protein